MESLDGTDWDVVIAGSGLAQSLFALAVSRSGLKVLHLDRNEYYGGDEAALSLREADDWVAAHDENPTHDSSTSRPKSRFSHASIFKVEPKDDGEPSSKRHGKLGPPRNYSLALAPQIIYARSNLLPALVSSCTHSQLEFQAVGSWFHTAGTDTPTLLRVPGGREDIVYDTSLDLKAKRSVMKFLRFVGNYEEKEEEWKDWEKMSLPTALEQKFNLPRASHGPLLALTLSNSAPETTTVAQALPRIARHLRSIGVFGAGFGAVFPKYGGLAEVAQVACRACAVGGGVYVLGKAIKSTEKTAEATFSLELSDGEKISAKHLVRSSDDIPLTNAAESVVSSAALSRSISIVSSPLSTLFPPTSEGGVTPAGAVVVVPSTINAQERPIHILVHSSESGDCPAGQCVLYAAVMDGESSTVADSASIRLNAAVEALLKNAAADGEVPEVLWRLSYQQTISTPSQVIQDDCSSVLQPLSLDLALEDAVLDDVKAAWLKATKSDETTFMKFAPREGSSEDDNDL